MLKRMSASIIVDPDIHQVVIAKVFEPKVYPKLVLAKAMEFTRSPLDTAALEFMTRPNCMSPTTAFQESKAGAAATFQEVLPSARVRPS